MATYFTSDLHFGHQNIIRFCGRPFSSVDEMDEALITNWNARVTPSDTIHVVGDFSFHKEPKTLEILKRLNGHKHLTYGNHDKYLKQAALLMFESVKDLREIKVHDADAPNGSRRIVLCHYALRVWNGSCYQSWHGYGHSHGMMPDDPTSLSLDVGVDVWGYRPVSYDEIKAVMAKKTFKPLACGDKTERY